MEKIIIFPEGRKLTNVIFPQGRKSAFSTRVRKHPIIRGLCDSGG